MNNQINTQIIFEYLKDNNLSKTAFCKQCNLSHITYEKIINGEDFGIVSLFKIARQLNRPICDFLKQSWQIGKNWYTDNVAFQLVHSRCAI